MKSLICTAFAFLGAASLAPAAIVLINPSFESPDIANGTAQQGGITGWSTSVTPNGVYLVDNNTTQNQWFGQAVPDGQQAMSLAGVFASQQLNDDVNGAVMTSAAAQQFDISFYAGRRLGATGSGSGTFSVLLQAYNGSTYVGTLASQMFSLVPDANPSTIDLGLGVGQWSGLQNLSLTAPANSFAGNNIRVVFAANAPFGSGSGNLETAIDKVGVTLMPEPSSVLLGGLGLLAMLRRRR